MIKEGIYIGKVWHHRLTPKVHRFQSSMLMVALDLSLLERHALTSPLIVHNRFGMFSLRSRDHFPGSELSMAENIKNLMPESVRNQPHRILLLTQLAHFGFAFNPISFFVVMKPTSDDVIGLILEVHNTPWGERHYYPVFDFQSNDDGIESQFKKVLHVSPFMEMDYTYAFAMKKRQNNLVISMSNCRDNVKNFTAGISMQYQPLEPARLRKAFIRHPFSPHKTVAAIYWHAFWLWFKGVPFCPHP